MWVEERRRSDCADRSRIHGACAGLEGRTEADFFLSFCSLNFLSFFMFSMISKYVKKDLDLSRAPSNPPVCANSFPSRSVASSSWRKGRACSSDTSAIFKNKFGYAEMRRVGVGSPYEPNRDQKSWTRHGLKKKNAKGGSSDDDPRSESIVNGALAICLGSPGFQVL